MQPPQREQLRERTKQLAVRVVRLVRCLPNTDEARIMGRQLLRSGTSVGANYRATLRARSKAEFTARLGVGVEEADETVFWLELLVACGIVPARRLTDLIREAEELLHIFAAARRTARRKKIPSP